MNVVKNINTVATEEDQDRINQLKAGAEGLGSYSPLNKAINLVSDQNFVDTKVFHVLAFALYAINHNLIGAA